jgi:hypothetical protein
MTFTLHEEAEWNATRSALLRIGWRIKRESSSHKTFHVPVVLTLYLPSPDRDEIGPMMR